MAGRSIYIIGSGAVGKCLAVFLKFTGREAILVRGSVNHQQAVTKDIIVEMSDGARLQAQVTETTLSQVDVLDGIVVVAIKSYGNATLAKSIREKVGKSPVVILQNGLGVERPFIAMNYPSLYRVVQFVTCQTIGPDNVRVKPVAACPVGVVTGSERELDEIVAALTTEQFKFRTEKDIESFTWRKAIINCAFNSICPLLETDNGIFHRNAEVLAIARTVISECVVVAETLGIKFTVDDLVENLLLISKSSDGQLISTLVDIQKGQQTEIDTLNLEVARLADEAGIGDKVQVTRMLGEMVKVKGGLRKGMRV